MPCGGLLALTKNRSVKKRGLFSADGGVVPYLARPRRVIDGGGDL